jgi:malonyl-CoA O-methyltransferase
MRDLKAIGAQNATAGRPRGLTGRRRLQAVEAAYEQYRHEGLLPASYEVVFGQAWAPAADAGRSRRRRDEFAIAAAMIGRRQGQPRG